MMTPRWSSNEYAYECILCVYFLYLLSIPPIIKTMFRLCLRLLYTVPVESSLPTGSFTGLACGCGPGNLGYASKFSAWSQ